MTDTPASATVWIEIPVTNLDSAMAFYASITGYPLTLDASGPAPVANFAYGSGVGGHLCVGTPARNGQGPLVHLAVTGTAEAAAERCLAAGGKVVSPVIAIPPGRFTYARDPDGNAIGLFAPAA